MSADTRHVHSPAELPAAIAPARDLWPGIAQGIAATPQQDAPYDPAAAPLRDVPYDPASALLRDAPYDPEAASLRDVPYDPASALLRDALHEPAAASLRDVPYGPAAVLPRAPTHGGSRPAYGVALPASVAVLPPRRRSAAWTAALGLAATVACLALGVWIGRATLPAADGAAVGSAPGSPALAVAFAPDERHARERQALRVQAGLAMAQLAPAERRKVEASLATLRGAIADLRQALGTDPGNLLLQEMLVNSYQDEIRVLTAVKEAGAAGQEI